MASNDALHWQSLRCLAAQYAANINALRSSYPAIADALKQLGDLPVEIAVCGDAVQIRVCGADGTFDLLPNPLPAAAAEQVASNLFPNGLADAPVLLTGLDQGWLWIRLHRMQAVASFPPGHRPPLYLLCREPLRLHVALHLQDFRALLNDARVKIYFGTDAVRQFIEDASDHPNAPLPRLNVTVDPALWPAGENLDSALQTIGRAWETKFQTLKTKLVDFDANILPADWIVKIRNAIPLRILGITSRYTTFLQYSMRDWLESLQSLGHETRLLIEASDHEQVSPLTTAATCLEFRPDLILLIDHFRAEIAGLPSSIPCVMWIQDRLPHLFDAKAGTLQGPADYAIGQGRVECVHTFGYPSSRFMPAMIGTDPSRFSISVKPDETLACDVSFVSHASQPVAAIIDAEIARLGTAHAKALLGGIFESLKQIYDQGGRVTQPHEIDAIIQHVLVETKTAVPDQRPLLDFFTHRVNNALFRHQAIGWIAETDVDLRLYGKGWESHPKFKKYARGVADNQTMLAGVYRASRINLQVTPFGAAHQRLFDGLAAGGFFLMRRCPGDRFDQVLREISRWCTDRQITDDRQLQQKADDSVRAWLDELQLIDSRSVLGRGYDFVAELRATADEGFVRSAGTLWPEFRDVSFDSKAEAQQKVTQFLANPLDRARIASSMRQRVTESLTYREISRRMLAFVTNDINLNQTSLAA